MSTAFYLELDSTSCPHRKLGSDSNVSGSRYVCRLGNGEILMGLSTCRSKRIGTNLADASFAIVVSHSQSLELCQTFVWPLVKDGVCPGQVDDI